MLLRRVTNQMKMAIASACIASLSILLVPICDNGNKGETNPLSFVVAGLFWISLISEQVFFWMAYAGQKNVRSRTSRSRRPARGSIGLITFGSSREAMISDLALGISLVATVALVLCDVQSYWLIALSVAILFLSLNLHCILNGKTYRYIKAINKTKKERKRNEK